MCLIAKTNKLKKAENDIRCFKRIEFIIDECNNITFHTPYIYASVPIETMIGNNDFVAMDDYFKDIEDYNGKYYIRGGLIHSYIIEGDAKHYSYDDEIIVECVIPKGTEYIEGFDSWGCPCFASRKLRLVSFKAECELRKVVIEQKHIQDESTQNL